MEISTLSTESGSTVIRSGRGFLEAIGAPNAELAREEVQLLVDAAIEADRCLTSSGLTLSVYDDMDAFVAIVEAAGKFVPTIFDRRIKPTPRRGESLGLVARDGQGQPIATLAVRLCRLHRTLADHLSTLSLFYANPLEQMESGEYLVIKGDARRYAEKVEDRGVWIGCFWVSPAFRGEASNLSGFLPVAGQVIGSMRWGRNIFFSLTETWLRKQHAHARVGSPDVYEAVEWYRPQLPEADRRRRSEILLMVYEWSATVMLARQLSTGAGQLRVRPQPAGSIAAAG